jgi:hypothetical protein
LTFQTGEDTKYFYFMGQYPATNGSLTIMASDAATVLTSGSTTWGVTAKKGWLGTLGQMFDSVNHITGNLSWFRTGVKAVSSRIDAAQSIWDLHFDATKTYLYVVDRSSHRVMKYDYINQKYIGWIGGFSNPGNVAAPIDGSNKSAAYPNLPTTALCKQTTSGQITPGWCVGGQSYADLANVSGIMGSPVRLTDDGQYIYVVMNSDRNANNRNHIVARYDAESGAFAGWIGGINTGGTPTGAASGGPGTCSTAPAPGVTPGWCVGGIPTWNTSYSTAWGHGTGAMTSPQAIASDNTFIYVGTFGAVLKYTKSTGTFAGWIGKADNVAPTGPGVGGLAGCTSMSSGQTTPGWCIGGKYQTAISGSSVQAGGIYNPNYISVDTANDILYVLDSGYYNGLVNQYRASTGAYLGKLSGLGLNWNGTLAFTKDSVTGNFYFADSNRIVATDSTGVVQGWLGKVSSSSGLSDALGNTSGQCSGLQPNGNTPGWCLGGTAKQGMDELAFTQTYAMEDDGQGNLLVAQYQNPMIKKFNKETGVYGGALVATSAAPTTWSNDANVQAEYYGFGDNDFNSPAGSYADGQYLFVADSFNARVKKISLATGALVGWVGAVTTSPTGGTSAGCLTTNPMSTVNSWCYGGLPNPWLQIGYFLSGTTQNGLFQKPHGIAGDGTGTTEANFIYVVDKGLHRINKINAKTGAFVGWIGKIGTTPTGGDLGCTDFANLAAVGKFTPGWCTGGSAQAGSDDGALYFPSAITYAASTGYIYVTDDSNNRIVSYDVTTGAFKGWIGAIATAPTSGCTTAANGSGYSVSTSGWCRGGTAREANGDRTGNRDRGGGYQFWSPGSSSVTSGITTDGTYLYVSNMRNFRIDRVCISSCPSSAVSGAWVGAASVNPLRYVGVWTDVPADLIDGTKFAGYYVLGIWSDANYIYGVQGAWGSNIFKMSKATGQMIGWQGAITPGNSPAGGDPGCAGATSITPGWCQGGGWIQGYKMGMLSAASDVTGDSNYIYATDINTHRVTRFPK